MRKELFQNSRQSETMTDGDADRTTKEEKRRTRFREKIHRAFGQTHDLRRLLVNMYLPQQERPHNLREFRSRCSFTYLHKPCQT